MKTTTLKTKAISILLVLALMLPMSAFAADTMYTVTLAVNRTDLGSVSGDGEYANGDTVTLTATAKYDNVFFAYWLDSSVTLSEEPTAAELEAAIVSYDSTYTFTAAQNVSLTAVFAYNSSISVNGMYYANEDEIFSGEESGNYIEEIGATTEIGKQSVTISASDYDEYVTVDNVVYERNCMFTWTYDQTIGQTVYTTHDSLSIPVAPVYNSVEYWAYLAEYEAPVTVAYVPHTHSYSAATCTTPATCSCGATTGDVDSANHAETYWVKLDYYHREYCVDCDTALTELESHAYDNNDDMICNICEYEREASHGDAHIWSESWTSNETHHWHNCTADGRCDLGAIESRNGYATHSFADKAVAIDGDVHARKCTVCNRTLEQESHNFDVVEAEGADGHRIRCSECGGSKLEAHVFADDSDAICDTCGYVRSIVHTHAYTTWKPSEYNPETYHVLCCSVCGEMSDPVQVAGHNYEVKKDKDGHWNLCTDCGYTTAKTAHRMTVSQWEGTSLVHINTCSVCQHEVTENCDFKQGTYAGNEDGHWAVCFACGRTHSGIPLQNHVDENADGTCDECGEKYTPPHTHSYKDKYDSTGHYTECDCGEKTEVQAHSYTGILDATCDCGYNRGLFVTNDDGKDFFEVGFIPGDGVTLPDDAELVVEDHYPSLAPIASTVVPTAETEYVDIPENNISRLEDKADSYMMGEIIVIDGEKYMVCDGVDVLAHLIRLSDKAKFTYYVQSSMLVPSSSRYDVEIQINRTIVINGAKYDVPATIAHNGIEQYAVLYVDGVLAGLYSPSANEAAFVEGYDPETLKAQQGDNDLGSVTIPADYNNAAIADFAPGKTYTVSVIGSNDISVEGYDDALLNSITGDTPEIAAAKAELERLKADRDAKKAALDQLDAHTSGHMEAWAAWNEAVEAYEEALASLADLTNLQGATVTQTFKIPDALVGAKNVTYVAVHDTNPFAAELAEAERVMKLYEPGSADYSQAMNDYTIVKHHYDAREKEHGSGAEYGTVTISLDGLTLTATHTAVKGFSPFIVYAFVEADEPEYKEISATLHTEHTYEKGKCTVCGEADPDYVPEGSSPQTGDNSHMALWIACAFISGGAVITLTVVDRKRRTVK